MMKLLFVTALLIIGHAYSTDQYGNIFHIGLLKNYKYATTSAWLEITTNSSNLVKFTVSYGNSIINGEVNGSHSSSLVDLPVTIVVSHIFQRYNGIEVATKNPQDQISVVVYNWENGSVGSYLALPSRDLSIREYKYFLLSTGNIHQFPSLWSEGLLVGTRDNTTVTITPSVPIYLPYDVQTPFLPRSRTYRYIKVDSRERHTFTIHRLQTLYFGKPDVDITGTSVVSSHPLTVITGHECGNVPSNVKWCEHLTQQVPPVATWGRRFLLAPFRDKESGQYYKILSSQNDTLVYQTCSNYTNRTHHLTARGDSVSIFGNYTTYCYISSDKPILVAQLATGSTHDGIGDPVMILVQPIEQFTQKFHFNVQSNESFNSSYVSILVHTAKRENLRVKFDKEPLSTNWTAIYDIKQQIVGYGANLVVSCGIHFVDIIGHTGSVLLYGFNSSPQRGYGFPTAVKLTPINEEPWVEFSQSEYVVRENSVAVLKIKRRLNFRKLTIHLSTSLGTADLDDFRVIDNVINFDIGESEREVKVMINDDYFTEPIECFIINVLLSTNNNSLYNSTILITDDDSAAVGFVDNSILTHKLLTVNIGIVSGLLQYTTTVQIMLNVTIQLIDGTNFESSNKLSLNSYIIKSGLHFNLSRVANIIPGSLIIVSLSLPTCSNGINITFINQSINYSVLDFKSTTTSSENKLTSINITPTSISNEDTKSIISTLNINNSPTTHIFMSTTTTNMMSMDSVTVVLPESSNLTAANFENFFESFYFLALAIATSVIIFFIVLLILVIIFAVVVRKKQTLEVTTKK